MSSSTTNALVIFIWIGVGIGSSKEVGANFSWRCLYDYLILTQWEAVLLAHRLIQENVIEFVVKYNSGPGLGSVKPV